MVAPVKKDYSSIAPAVTEAYNRIKNITKVARLFNMSPVTCRRILDEHKVQVGRPGVHNSKHQKRTFEPDSCHFCHKYSRTTNITGWCILHRRSVAGRNQEPCFN